jgi:hypothetical protein
VRANKLAKMKLILLTLTILLLVFGTITNVDAKKNKKFDGDFVFVDEVSTKDPKLTFIYYHFHEYIFFCFLDFICIFSFSSINKFMANYLSNYQRWEQGQKCVAIMLLTCIKNSMPTSDAGLMSFRGYPGADCDQKASATDQKAPATFHTKKSKRPPKFLQKAPF